jgi:hypothetical protein
MTMKRILSALLVCVLLVGCVFALASCGKTLSGTYSSGKVLGSGVSYTFKGNDVTVTYSIAGFEKSINGTYEITTNDEDQEVIIFTFGEGEENADDYAGEFAFAEGKEGDTEYIKIGGVKYNKQ